MKVTVNRELRGGLYYVSFKVSDFAPEEVQKMQSFGVPLIKITTGGPGSYQKVPIRLTQIDDKYKGGFASEVEAKKNEEEVMLQIREAMAFLRERRDDFTSTEEVKV